MHPSDYGALLGRRPQAARAAVKVIAAATDFSPAAGDAVRRAAQLACAHDARMALMHVMRPLPALLAGVLRVAGRKDRPEPGEALSNLRRTAARIIAEFGVPIDTELASGHVASAVAALSRAAHADLVVLGSTRSSFFRDLLSINTARSVRSQAGIPVLAVSRPVRRAYRRVLLLAADLSPEAARAQAMARRLFPAAMLTVVHVFESPYEGLSLASARQDAVDEHRGRMALQAAQRLEAFACAAGFDGKAVLEVRKGDPAACMRMRVRELDADLVVLPAVTPSLEGAMTSGAIEQLLADPPCDVLLAA